MNVTTKTSILALLTAIGLSAALPAFAAVDTDGDGVPDTAEPLIHSDPLNADTDGDSLNDLKDDNPVFAEYKITTDGTAAPFSIKEALVEDNFDPVARKDAPDHLELQVANASSQDLSGFSVYYKITDNDTGDTEAYYKVLDGFTVPTGKAARIHFDDSGVTGHFRANPNSIYTTSQNAKVFDVTLKADGFQPVTVDIQKDAGGAEAAD